MSHHRTLIEKAIEAIDAVFSDKSVSPATTLESMEQIAEAVSENIDVLKSTLEDEDDLGADR
jgi:hypothetical protein